MSEPNERHVIRVSLTLIGFCLADVLPSYAQVPNLFYDPLARRWLFGPSPGPIPLGYLGTVAYGVVGACAGFVASLAIRHTPSPRTFGLFGAWALSALWLSVAYFTWSLWPG